MVGKTPCRFLAVTVAILALAFVTAPALACPFCSMQGQTLIGDVNQASMVLFGTLSSCYEITYVSNATMPTSRLSVQVYSPQGCGEQTCEVTGNVPKESAIESPTLPESSAHSLAPDLAPRS